MEQFGVVNSKVLTNIYGLYDPREQDKIEYVGKANDIKQRLKDHISGARPGKFYKSKKNNWIKSLLEQGIKPEVLLIAVVRMDQWKENECSYIEKYKKLNLNLKNDPKNLGGEGISYLTPEERSKKAMFGENNPFYNKTHTEEARRILREKGLEFFKTPDGIVRRKEISKERKNRDPWNKGLKLTDEKYKKAGKKNKGRKASEATKKLQSVKSKERIRQPLSEQHKINISIGRKGIIPKYTKEQMIKEQERKSGDKNPMSRINIEKRKLLKEQSK